MGAKKQKTEKFLATHPICFFCGSEATTIDHVPHRDCFLNKIGPEGFEFPACDECNNSAGRMEQVVALYLHMTSAEQDAPEPVLRRLLTGVRNNTPTFLPREMRANEKRQAMRAFNTTLEEGQTYSDVPLLMLPEEGMGAFRIFARRLTCALYYKHLNAVMPATHLIRTDQVQWAKDRAGRVVEALQPLLPNGVTGQRQNTNIGEQFEYIWYGDKTSGSFAFAALIAKAYMFMGIAVADVTDLGTEGYSAHSLDFAARAIDI